MPLLELVDGADAGRGAAAAAAAPAAANGAASKWRARRRAPQLQDVCTLLVRVVLRVLQGQQLTLDTVKAAWRELGFSHVFEVGACSQRRLTTWSNDRDAHCRRFTPKLAKPATCPAGFFLIV